MVTIFFGTLSALIWGAGDFAGAISSRRTGPYRAVFYCETFGLLVLFGAALFVHEAPLSLANWVLCIIMGICGGIGALILYTAIGRGKLSIAVPISALVTATIPIVTDAAILGLPTPVKLIGFILTLLATWMVAQNKESKSRRSHLSDLRLPVLSGLCFGLYFILLHETTHDSLLTPLIVSRFVGILVVIVFMLIKHKPWGVKRSVWPFIIINGTLDIGGNIFYILAAQNGRMDVAAVLSSLYPGVTALLAWLIIKERISRLQKLGILTSIIAIALMTL